MKNATNKAIATAPSGIAWRWTALALSLGLLHGCGGGGGGAASGSAAVSALTAGTVTGFGSVVVDGTEIEDAQARVVRENPDGSLRSDVLQMGQRVRVAHDARKVASQVTVDAALVGQASNVDALSGTLKVAGQNVTVNSDASKGPVTVFGSAYTDLGSVQANDTVEIHGTPVYNSSNTAYTVQATRISKTESGVKVQISGKISGYSATGASASFTLNGLSVQTSASTAVRPASSTLANDLQVTAYSSSALSGATLEASHIRVDRQQDSASTGAVAQLSGVVSALDASSLTLNNIKVAIGNTAVTDLGGRATTLKAGAYVLVSGNVASDGSITATSIKVRTADTNSDLARVMLVGPITDFVDTGSFVVRGVPVDASLITWATACPGVTAANDVQVRVQAAQQAGSNVVQAQSLVCAPTSGMQVIRSQEGAASQVDAAAKTFTLTPDGAAARSVQWNEATSFLGLAAPVPGSDTLGGKSVHVDGYLSGPVLVARVVRLDDDSLAAPKPDGAPFLKPRAKLEQVKQAWDAYRKQRPRP